MSRKNNRKRISSPAGTEQRLESRVRTYTSEIPKGAAGTTRGHKPGSRNRRKVGR